MNRAFGFGIGSLLVGIGLYVAVSVVALHRYDGHTRPTWLSLASIVAAGLVTVGLLVMANVAVRVYRERS